MASHEKTVKLITTCVLDYNGKDICLNDVVYSVPDEQYGFITRRKKVFYFENMEILKKLCDFSNSTPNFSSQTSDLKVIHAYQEIEDIIRNMFNSIEI